MVRLFTAAFLLLSTTARALPPDRVVFLEIGGDTFIEGPEGSWVATSTGAEVVEAKYFPAAEVHLLAKAEGTVLVILTNRVLGQAKFWEVRVGKQKRARPDPAVLRDACGCYKYPLECQVKNLKCLDVLRRFVKDTDLTSDDLRLKYNVEGLQALLRDLQTRLEKAGFEGMNLAFLGANLRLLGKVEDEDAWRRLLVCLYRGMVGKLVIENRVKIRKTGLRK